MSAPLRRGACPSIAAPMLTGDGWLARLAPVALTPAQLGGLAEAALRLGNGTLEVTARGSLQIRGLSEGSAAELPAAVAALGVVAPEGLPVLVGPLAGIDARECADPRPLAEVLQRRAAERGLHARLLPKVAVTVDGGGALGLEAVGADLRLAAVRGRGAQSWSVALGGTAAAARLVGTHPAEAAIATAVTLLEAMAERGIRGRDLLAELPVAEGSGGAPDSPARPVGRFDLASGLSARGFGLPFGQTSGETLRAFARLACRAADIRPAPGRALIATGLAPEQDAALVLGARRLGLIVEPEDPRLAVVACSGAPACASARGATRAFAEDIAARRPDLLGGTGSLHVSGCPKRCAQPAGPAVTLLATSGGFEIAGDGAPAPHGLRAFLRERFGAGDLRP